MNKKQRHILFIAPIPPPITGMSLVSETLMRILSDSHEIYLVNFSKDTFKQGITSLQRIAQVIRNTYRIYRLKRSTDLVYLTISQTIAGNIKDLITLAILFNKPILLHLHGGGILHTVYRRMPLLKYINYIMLKRVQAIIVLGNSLKNQFEGVIHNSKIRVVHNFADKSVFLNEKAITQKYENDTLNILFLSNLIPGKGYIELLKAAVDLIQQYPKVFRVHFAGGFENDIDEKNFRRRISSYPDIIYYGVVGKNKKIDLLKISQILCLPTYYLYEGQPLSILEAYASGCYVITTNHGGIQDIFTPGINGDYVEKKSIRSLKGGITKVKELGKENIKKIGIQNYNIAKTRYSEAIFRKSMLELFHTINV